MIFAIVRIAIRVSVTFKFLESWPHFDRRKTLKWSTYRIFRYKTWLWFHNTHRSLFFIKPKERKHEDEKIRKKNIKKCDGKIFYWIMTLQQIQWFWFCTNQKLVQSHLTPDTTHSVFNWHEQSPGIPDLPSWTLLSAAIISFIGWVFPPHIIVSYTFYFSILCFPYIPRALENFYVNNGSRTIRKITSRRQWHRDERRIQPKDFLIFSCFSFLVFGKSKYYV